MLRAGSILSMRNKSCSVELEIDDHGRLYPGGQRTTKVERVIALLRGSQCICQRATAEGCGEKLGFSIADAGDLDFEVRARHERVTGLLRKIDFERATECLLMHLSDARNGIDGMQHMASRMRP